MFINEINKAKEYDVAIMGSGPAGISLALGLQEQTVSKARIILVESGELVLDRDKKKLAEVSTTGDRSKAYYSRHAQRVFGGTSNIWEGFCTTLEARSFLNNEWPLNYSSLEPYYEKAAAILDLPQVAYQRPSQPLGDGNAILYKPFYLSAPTRFGTKYHDYFDQAEHTDVLLNHTCTRVLHRAGHVDAVMLQDSDSLTSPPQRLKAKYVVLACGGLGNPQLLQGSGIGQGSPVGFYLMDHPHIYHAGRVELDKKILDAVLGVPLPERVLHALQFSDSFCLQNNLLNFSVSFSPESVKETSLLGDRKQVYDSDASIRSEMRPLRTNRIFLVRRDDGSQRSKSHVNFRFESQQLAKDSWKTFANLLLTQGIGRASVPPDSYKKIIGGGHFIGTTRIGPGREDSVADADCKVHDIDNLFLAGSSIFPAAGAANPTFSIVAFSLRLAKHLSKKI